LGSRISIAALDRSGSFNAYRAEPEGTPKGAIVVIQEIFGVNSGIRARCDRWAKAGYQAYALDLFWRVEPGVDLDPDVPEQFQQALALMNRFDRDKGIADIEATIRTARAEAGGKVGVVGYCLGGLLAYLTATRTDADATVGYYGVMIDNFINESHCISRPFMLHFDELDGFVPAETLTKIRDGLADNPRVSIHSYAGVDHGFATESGNRRREEAAQLADARTLDFFAQHVG